MGKGGGSARKADVGKHKLTGKMASKRSKTGDPVCSQAMSAWKTNGMTPQIAATLGRCRSMSRRAKQAVMSRAAGHEARAQHQEHQARRGLTDAGRKAKAGELRGELATRRAERAARYAVNQPTAPKAAPKGRGGYPERMAKSKQRGAEARTFREEIGKKSGVKAARAAATRAGMVRGQAEAKKMQRGLSPAQRKDAAATARAELARRRGERANAGSFELNPPAQAVPPVARPAGPRRIQLRKSTPADRRAVDEHVSYLHARDNMHRSRQYAEGDGRERQILTADLIARQQAQDLFGRQATRGGPTGEQRRRGHAYEKALGSQSKYQRKRKAQELLEARRKYHATLAAEGRESPLGDIKRATYPATKAAPRKMETDASGRILLRTRTDLDMAKAAEANGGHFTLAGTARASTVSQPHLDELYRVKAEREKARQAEAKAKGTTKYMFDMKRGDLPGQTSMFDPRPTPDLKAIVEAHRAGKGDPASRLANVLTRHSQAITRAKHRGTLTAARTKAYHARQARLRVAADRARGVEPPDLETLNRDWTLGDTRIGVRRAVTRHR